MAFRGVKIGPNFNKLAVPNFGNPALPNLAPVPIKGMYNTKLDKYLDKVLQNGVKSSNRIIQAVDVAVNPENAVKALGQKLIAIDAFAPMVAKGISIFPDLAKRLGWNMSEIDQDAFITKHTKSIVEDVKAYFIRDHAPAAKKAKEVGALPANARRSYRRAGRLSYGNPKRARAR